MSADPDNDGVAFTLDARLPGQVYDAESGLHDNYFRDYDPTTGRYLEADPIGQAGGLNPYSYAREDPTTFTDPRGLAVLYVGNGTSVGAGVATQAQVAYAIDTSGNVGVVLTAGGGVEVGVTGQMSLVAGASNAPEISDLAGPAVVGGASIGGGLSAGAEVGLFRDRAGDARILAELLAGPSIGTPFEGHAVVTGTTVIPLFNVSDIPRIAREYLCSRLGVGCRCE